jgi:ASC-1-like (ASCH) protein
MIIAKKTWPELFKKVKEGKKSFDVRLADFKLKKGDTLILREWNPRTKKYTGRTLTRKIGFVLKIPEDMKRLHTEKDIKRYGSYVMELD